MFHVHRAGGACQPVQGQAHRQAGVSASGSPAAALTSHRRGSFYTATSLVPPRVQHNGLHITLHSTGHATAGRVWPLQASFGIVPTRPAVSCLRVPVSSNVRRCKSSMSDLWGPIDLKSWQAVACVSARQATEADVRQGRAVFYIDGQSEPHEMKIPCLGLQLKQGGPEVKVVIIQAENSPSGPILGVRYFDGGNGICTLDEVRIE